MLDAADVDQSWSTSTLPQGCRMSTLDEITKEKQRISEALARVNAQHEKLSGQLSELEATERVLARYSNGKQTKRRASGNATTLLQHNQAAAGGPQRRNRLAAIAARRASAIRSLPWQRARHSGKLPPHARRHAQTISASPLPGTSGPAESRSATGSSTQRTRQEPSSTPWSESTQRGLCAVRS